MDEAVLIEANMNEGALKIGLPNSKGWMGYVKDNLLFIKKAAYDPNLTYLDKVASSQCYCAPNFIELETLGEFVDLGPGETCLHTEKWELSRKDNWPAEIKELLGLIET